MAKPTMAVVLLFLAIAHVVSGAVTARSLHAARMLARPSLRAAVAPRAAARMVDVVAIHSLGHAFTSDDALASMHMLLADGECGSSA